MTRELVRGVCDKDGFRRRPVEVIPNGIDLSRYTSGETIGRPHELYTGSQAASVGRRGAA